ncbi:MAG: UDP-N-acetylmuramyl-tripeptide synthetase, partial [Patescibacteria group bacterium]
NPHHMTMPGRFILQKYLKDMADAGCKFAIVETTSEGIKQWRHSGIDYDVAVFTNLYHEHLTSHGGSFDKYREAKGKLFSSLKPAGVKNKVLGGEFIPKIIITNTDSEFGEYFSSFPADKKITYGIASPAEFRAVEINNSNKNGWPASTQDGAEFVVGGEKYELSIPGEFNIENALPAIAICKAFGIKSEAVQLGLKSLKNIPGRMERIDAGQPFKVYVDYAHQKESMEALLLSSRKMISSEGKVIVLLGAEGGGRDVAKRAAMGEVTARLADLVVVSNVDPYEDDPVEIAEGIARSAEAHGKVRNENLFVVLDRRAGIHKALTLAKPEDIVLITGKGSEQSMVIYGKTIPWDDREIVKEELFKVSSM